MARSFSNSKLISAFVVDTVSSFVSRRGYAAASSTGVSGGVRGSGVNIMMKKQARRQHHGCQIQLLVTTGQRAMLERLTPLSSARCS